MAKEESIVHSNLTPALVRPLQMGRGDVAGNTLRQLSVLGININNNDARDMQDGITLDSNDIGLKSVTVAGVECGWFSYADSISSALATRFCACDYRSA